MDPVDVIDLCRKAAHEGAPRDVFIPHVFSVGDYQELWLREPKKVREILDDLLCAEFPGDGLELLLKFNVIYALFPELAAIKDLGDADGLHKDVWTHTKNVVAGVPNQLELRWGSLLHDVGKARTRRIVKGRVTFHNHDRVGARMVDKLHERTNLFQSDTALFRTVRLLVFHHLRPASYRSSWSDSAVRRFTTECADPGFFQKLMTLSRADLTTKIPAKRNKCLAKSDELVKRVEALLKEDFAPKLPKGTMGIILERSGKKPGAWLGSLRGELERMLRSGEVPPEQSADSYATYGLCLLTKR